MRFKDIENVPFISTLSWVQPGLPVKIGLHFDWHAAAQCKMRAKNTGAPSDEELHKNRGSGGALKVVNH